MQKLLSIQIIPISFLFVEITYILRWNLFCKPLMAFLSHGHEQTVTYKVTSILLEAALLKALYHWSFSVSRALHWEEILWISKNMTILVYHLFLPFRPIQYQTGTNEFRLKSCQFVFNRQMRNLVPRRYKYIVPIRKKDGEKSWISINKKIGFRYLLKKRLMDFSLFPRPWN